MVEQAFTRYKIAYSVSLPCYCTAPCCINSLRQSRQRQIDGHDKLLMTPNPNFSHVQRITLPRNAPPPTTHCNWRPNRLLLHRANEFPCFPRHRASGVSHPPWQCGLLSFRLLLEPSSPWPARRGGSTQKSARCVVYMPHEMPLMIFLMQAAEKSLSLLRSSPEQVTANLASGTFPSVII
jgi:hypothetical protein